MTKDEVVRAHPEDLALEVARLEDQVEVLTDKLSRYERGANALDNIIDRLAEIGLIESDRHTKMLYREGRRVI